MNKSHTSKSQFQLALDVFWQNRMARIAFWILSAFYACAIFADILSPYSFKNENRDYSFCPPSQIHWFDESGKLAGPFVYGSDQTFDEYRRRIFTENKTQKYPLKFWIKGDVYKFLGLFKMDRHVFGVEEPGRLYLWGADSRGRDLLSRIFYGARVSLSIGLME
jgi:peptide/nickel transport system permease protein